MLQWQAVVYSGSVAVPVNLSNYQPIQLTIEQQGLTANLAVVMVQLGTPRAMLAMYAR